MEKKKDNAVKKDNQGNDFFYLDPIRKFKPLKVRKNAKRVNIHDNSGT